MTESSISIWHLVSTADPVVKTVMLILLLASIWSWTIIFQRFSIIRMARVACKRFEAAFWSGLDLSAHYQKLSTSKQKLTGIDAIFHGAFSQFLRHRQTPSNDIFVTSIERGMRVPFTEEVDRLEKGLPVLATIGSVSPFVGLFGTVWGIMGSFKALAGVQQATLSMVAPGISEALIATAMGLFVAIPAVVAYNRYTAAVERLQNRYENCEDELLNILQRQHASASEPAHA